MRFDDDDEDDRRPNDEGIELADFYRQHSPRPWVVAAVLLLMLAGVIAILAYEITRPGGH